MNFAIQYVTSYRYSQPVADNLNALRVRPLNGSSQRCDEFHVRVDPDTRLHRHTDYFGTEVIEFGVPRAHDHLSIDVRARVVTSERPAPPDGDWDALRSTGYAEAAGEFTLPTGGEPAEEAIADLVAASRAETPLATLRGLCDLIPDRFEYRAGVTYVGSTVDDLLAAGAGVCQDFAHLAVVLLKAHGIAARYVSGYLWAAPEDGGADSMEVQTHAWVEALLPGVGSGSGRGEPVWVGADPTNRRLAGEGHVKIGHGRTYADVPPIKGVFRGAASTELEARVQMTRLDPTSSARA